MTNLKKSLLNLIQREAEKENLPLFIANEALYYEGFSIEKDAPVEYAETLAVLLLKPVESGKPVKVKFEMERVLVSLPYLESIVAQLERMSPNDINLFTRRLEWSVVELISVFKESDASLKKVAKNRIPESRSIIKTDAVGTLRVTLSFSTSTLTYKTRKMNMEFENIVDTYNMDTRGRQFIFSDVMSSSAVFDIRNYTEASSTTKMVSVPKVVHDEFVNMSVDVPAHIVSEKFIADKVAKNVSLAHLTDDNKLNTELFGEEK